MRQLAQAEHDSAAISAGRAVLSPGANELVQVSTSDPTLLLTSPLLLNMSEDSDRTRRENNIVSAVLIAEEILGEG